jgi:hypothetical protein
MAAVVCYRMSLVSMSAQRIHMPACSFGVGPPLDLNHLSINDGRHTIQDAFLFYSFLRFLRFVSFSQFLML